MIPIGELKYYTTIQKLESSATNEYGEVNFTGSWNDEYSVWAKMEFKKGKESEIGMEQTNVDVFEFTFRAEPVEGSTWGKIVPTTYRLKLSGGESGADRIFEINASGYIGNTKQWIKLLCTEKTS